MTPIIQNIPSPSKAPPAVQQRRRRQRRVFDMSLEFVAMFNGPLPDQVVAALAEMFNLDHRMRHWSMPKIAKNLGLFAARG